CITLVRLITFRSAILARSVKISSWTPSAKKAFAFSSLKFSNGSTAMLFSVIGAACVRAFGAAVATALARTFDFAKYHVPRPIRQIRTAAPAQRIAFHVTALLTILAGVGLAESCSR